MNVVRITMAGSNLQSVEYSTTQDVETIRRNWNLAMTSNTFFSFDIDQEAETPVYLINPHQVAQIIIEEVEE